MRYSEQTQRGLDMHHDASEVTLNVCLEHEAPDTADDEAIARLLAAEYASPPVHAPPPPVRAAAKRAAAKVAR